MAYSMGVINIIVDISDSNINKIFQKLDLLSEISDTIEIVSPLHSDSTNLISKIKPFILKEELVSEWASTKIMPEKETDLVKKYMVRCTGSVINVLKNYKTAFADNIIDKHSEFDIAFYKENRLVCSTCPHENIFVISPEMGKYFIDLK